MSKAHLCIVEYNTPDLLERCINSATSQIDVSEITVFRNGTSEQHPAVHSAVTKFSDSPNSPNISGYADSVNYGYAASLNYVISEHVTSKTEFFVALNADVEFKTSSDVRNMMDFMKQHQVAIAGPKQVNSQGQITHAGIFGSNTRPSIRGWKQKDHGQYDDQRTDCVSVSGSAYFIDTMAIESLTSCPDYRSWILSACPGTLHMGMNQDGISGRFPTFIPTRHYYEETGLSYHAREHGYRIGYNGQVEMIHEWHQSSRVGGEVDSQMSSAREIFRDFCDWHDIEHD